MGQRLFGSYVRCLAADRFGRVFAELDPDIGPVLWKHNDIGQVKINWTKQDPKVTERLLHFGGRILLQFSNGLPDWGGVIDPPERWDKRGIIESAIYEAGYLLGTRQTAKMRRFVNETVGSILATIFNEVGAVSELGISLGNIWHGGDTYRVEYNYASLLKVIRDSLCGDLSDADWDVRPDIKSGHVIFRLTLYDRKGLTKNNVCLIEGHNAEIDFQRAGTITNYWVAAGSGTDWYASRRVGVAQNNNSISDYGLREGVRVLSGVANSTAALTIQAGHLLENTATPRNQYGVTTVDQEPAKFAHYDVGDTVRLMSHNMGHSGLVTDVRVLAREYDPSTGICKLIIEEVTE